MRQAIADDTYLLLEATCNQVNQAGGYTGMTPGMFRDYVYAFAFQLNFDVSRLILVAIILGRTPGRRSMQQPPCRRPRRWFSCVEAGFTKIHLDASMRCADDPEALHDEVKAARAATLCRAAEDARVRHGLGSVVYVIGTEVPVPGGATHSLGVLEVTRCEAAEQTLSLHRKAFLDAQLDAAWERVIALVVQPGVEFDHDSVIDYDARKAAHLQRFVQEHPTLVMEAHSTDYQLLVVRMKNWSAMALRS